MFTSQNTRYSGVPLTLRKKRAVEHTEHACQNSFHLQPNKNQLYSEHSLLLFPPILFFVYMGEHLHILSKYYKVLQNLQESRQDKKKNSSSSTKPKGQREGGVYMWLRSI